MRLHAVNWDLLSESALRDLVDNLSRLVEFAGALVIFGGAVGAFVRFVAAGFTWRRGEGSGGQAPVAGFDRIRLGLGRFLALGLEFQLAGDILRTAVAPTFPQIGQLAAIAAIRTALNYFLGREIKEERRAVESAASDATAKASGSGGMP
ncbi:DUF1622 domain-containing protein [Streptomyces sp. FXJ1.4098]|uniref:DUF1622 domain-containing protein n=1 Tax=Streptomyces sp. NPDC020845 TaxID=3365096 RepID=UPI0029909F5B|nr:DUF1622 domain-containing protein [Streptomyces sp. FXJ1.4098]